MQASELTEPSRHRSRTGSVFVLLAGAILVVVTAGCDFSKVATTATPTQQRTREQPLTLSGTSGTQTQPFPLAGGAYDVQWQASPGTRSSAYCGVELADVAGSGKTELLVNEGITTTKAGRSSVYSVTAGQHYLKVTDCGTWSVTISPQ